jgi:thiamine-phosphate pyrophosphorylase
MADALSRNRLARAAARLNARLPLVLMSDDSHDVLAAAKALTTPALIILRARDAKRRTALAQKLITLPHRLLIADDARLAAACGAAGLHLPEARAREAPHWRARHPGWIVTTVAHSLGGLLRAGVFGADAVFLSPVFSTASHPQRIALGAVRAALMAAQIRVPVYALGGIDARNAGLLLHTRFQGLAAISALDQT